jgi:UDP-2,4-diacetamido-2,4,6-trideoxy-beta-L-altropyranose hydrolase
MKVAFRVDANETIGTGHLMRCLALAEELARQGATCCFVSRNTPRHMLARIESAGHVVMQLPDSPKSPLSSSPSTAHGHWLGVGAEQDAEEFLGLLRPGRPDWTVVDHYALDAGWHKLVRSDTSKLLVIDDLADRAIDADLLLDQNLQPEGSSRYRQLVGGECQLLIGPRYALLRPEFSNAPRHRAALSDLPASQILVSLGGAAPAELNERILRAMHGLPALQVTLIANAADHARLEAAAPDNVTLSPMAATGGMNELMRSHDLAIGAGGIMTWERLSQGIPSLLLGIADNQVSVIETLLQRGLAHGHPALQAVDQDQLRSLIHVSLFNASLRKWQSAQGQHLVDGRGTGRVAHRMMGSDFQFRPAALSDAETIYAWRNSPAVRGVSHTRAPLEYESHLLWLQGTLANADRCLLIAEDDGQAVGVVRFDRREQDALISIYLAPDQIGRGRGSSVIRQSCAAIAERWPTLTSVHAEIQENNVQSLHSFAAAGFKPYSRTMTWHRNHD